MEGARDDTRAQTQPRLSADAFAGYPLNRKVTEPDVLETVDTLRKAGSKAKRILQYLHDTFSKSAVLKDVHDLLDNRAARQQWKIDCRNSSVISPKNTATYSEFSLEQK